MFSNADSVECKVSANIILAAAHRLFSYNKAPFAMMLVQIVLDQHPGHSQALMLRDTFAGNSPPEPGRMHHLYYDAEEGIFYVGEKGDPTSVAFQTLEEAERYLRSLK